MHLFVNTMSIVAAPLSVANPSLCERSAKLFRIVVGRVHFCLWIHCKL